MKEKIAIIGLGLIGGSIAKALKGADNNIVISAYDKPEILNTALKEKIINDALQNFEQALDSDIIFICLPIDTAINIFKHLAPNLRSNQILTDVCSVKTAFADIWSQIKSSGIYIGGHPMTGKEKGGYENSDALLFENSIYILTEDLRNNNNLENFRTIIESLGANILHVPPKQHDVIAASISHLPQLISVVLVNTASLKTDNYNFLDLAAGGFRDMTRIASSDFGIWKSIISENRGEIISAIEKFIFEVNKIKGFVYNLDYNELNDYFETARKSRDEIPQKTKGFLTPLHDIFIFVKDEPGVISKVSGALFENGINIKDIELLKIREGEGGTFRIAFESADDASSAKKILQSTGFRTN